MLVWDVCPPVLLCVLAGNFTSIDSEWRGRSCRWQRLACEILIRHHNPIDAVELYLVLLVKGVEVHTLLLACNKRWLDGLGGLSSHAFHLLLGSRDLLSRVSWQCCLGHWTCWFPTLARLTHLWLELDLWIYLLRWAYRHAWIWVLAALFIILPSRLLRHQPAYLGLLPVFFLYSIHGCILRDSCGGLCLNKSQWVSRIRLHVDGLKVLMLLFLVCIHDFPQVLRYQNKSALVTFIHLLVTNPR